MSLIDSEIQKGERYTLKKTKTGEEGPVTVLQMDATSVGGCTVGRFMVRTDGGRTVLVPASYLSVLAK